MSSESPQDINGFVDPRTVCPDVFICAPPILENLVREALTDVPPDEARIVYAVEGTLVFGFAHPPVAFVRDGQLIGTDEIMASLDPDCIPEMTAMLLRCHDLPEGEFLDYTLIYRYAGGYSERVYGRAHALVRNQDDGSVSHICANYTREWL